jgi:hypothetical protein
MTTDTSDSAFDGPAKARTAGKDIFGDFDDEIPAIRIPADVRLDALRAAAKEGMNLTAWVRELVYGSLYGPEHVATLHANRIRRVLGNAGQLEPAPAAPAVVAGPVGLPKFLRQESGT